MWSIYLPRINCIKRSPGPLSYGCRSLRVALEAPRGADPPPQPATLHSTPHTLHPASFTPGPTRYTLHPASCPLHPTPYTLYYTLYTLHPAPFTLHPDTLHPTHHSSRLLLSLPSELISQKVLKTSFCKRLFLQKSVSLSFHYH